MLDNFKYHLKRGLPFLITIIIILFIPAVMFLRENRFSFFDNNLHRGKYLREQHEKIRVADSLKSIDNKTNVRGEIPQNSFVKSDNDKNTEFEKDLKGTYYIIVGSFANLENANLAAVKYRSLGYKTSIISLTDRNGIKTELISVYTFNNFSEASRYLREFQNKFNPEAWIYSKK